MAVVVFDADEFRAAYPQFSKLSDEQLGAAFDTACLVLDNSESSPVPYDPDKGVKDRKTLLYMLVCHLATLALRGTGAVGVLTSASEGSVSTGFTLPPKLNDAGWYAQTQCGLAYWQAVRGYIVGGRYFAYSDCKQRPWRGKYFPRR